MLELVALTLAGMHFGVPLFYYLLLKHRYLKCPWNIKIDENYKPNITVIVPTYNEEKLIQSKLDNLYAQDYSKSLIEIIVVDGKSDDRTTELVRNWVSRHRDVKLALIEEPERCGMVPAINYVLQHHRIKGEIVVFTDVDAIWSANALTMVAKYFADPNIGAVTASIVPTTSTDGSVEGVYRNYYNLIRIAESRLQSTPVHNGALVAFRANLLLKMGGLPSYTGNNDSTPASIVAFAGYRAIQVDDVLVKEPVRGSLFRRKVRRAQHLLLSFIKTKRYAKMLGAYKYTKPFERIWKVEWWLHVTNPWLLISCVFLFLLSIFRGSFTALALLGTGLVLLTLKSYRTWVLNQLYLVIATIRNLWTKEIVWSK